MTKKKTEAKKEEGPELRPVKPMTKGRLLKFLQTRDMSARLEPDDRPVTPGPRGPMTGETSPLTELARTATPAELAEFAEIVRKRRGATETAWMRCDNPACGFVGKFRKSSLGGSCALCNWRSIRSSGHLQEMDAQAVAYYQETKAAKDRETVSRMELAALAGRNTERAKAGLAPLSLAAYRAEVKRDFELRVDRDRKLQEIVEKGGRLRAERMRQSEPTKA